MLRRKTLGKKTGASPEDFIRSGENREDGKFAEVMDIKLQLVLKTLREQIENGEE